jgi:hypothetical protein
MEEIKTTISEIENLVTLLLVRTESLEERKEVDSSEWFISRTLIAIKQLNKKLDTILGSKELKAPEELGMEIYKNK